MFETLIAAFVGTLLASVLFDYLRGKRPPPTAHATVEDNVFSPSEEEKKQQQAFFTMMDYDEKSAYFPKVGDVE